MHTERASLAGLEIEIFKLVSKGATREQWAEWLRAPLEHAAVQGNRALVDKLLGAGADGSAGWKGCGGRSLLYAAAVGGSEGVVSSLLHAGAQPEVNMMTPAPSSRSPLYQATSGGYEAAAKLLIHAGADVNFRGPSRERTVFHEALQRGHVGIAEGLLMCGADMNVRDSDERTPLHTAARKGLDRMVSALLLRGVDKDAVDTGGESALMGASCAYPAVVETLLAAGADLNIRGNYGESALDYASGAGCVPVIQALIRHGADVNSRCPISRFSALDKAVFADKACSIDALAEAGADVDTEMAGTRRVPVLMAAHTGSAKAVLALLQKGADINVRDTDGEMPLHVACLFRNRRFSDVVDILLRWGADETALDGNGSSPADNLDIVAPGICRKPAEPGDIERARQLLSRAPADRAWRRRGWLAMLRSRASRAETNAGGVGAEGSDNASSEVGENIKVARSEGAVGVGGEAGGLPSRGAGEAGIETLDGVGDRVFAGVVVRLVGLEVAGVFRTVLEFL